MLGSISADSIFAEIMMDETDARAFLLVEGVDENAIFFGHLSEEIVLIVAGGKPNVIGAATLAEAAQLSNVYSLVDNDFDRLRGRDGAYPENVISTTSYDLVADILDASPGSLRRILSAHAVNAVAVVEASTGEYIDRVVMRFVSALAGARLAVLRHDYPLVFREYNFLPVIDGNYKPMAVENFLTNAPCRDPSFSIDEQVVSEVYVALRDLGNQDHHCGGHDIVQASVHLLKRAGAQVSAKGIASTLIASATCPLLSRLTSLRSLSDLIQERSGVGLLNCSVV